MIFRPKKWDAFVFVTFNYYVAEITIVDLGLIGQISISLTKLKEKEQIVAEYFASVKLDDFFKGDIDIQTSGLQFSLKRSRTAQSRNVNITFKALHGNKTIVGNLRQQIPIDSCMTFVRPYSSIKCLTGRSEGSITSSYKIINTQYKYQQEITDSWGFNSKVATVLYDGFRGAGYNWYWIWGFGIGWNQNIEEGAKISQPIKNIGISLGFMLEKQQNFVTIQGEAIKLSDVTYEISDGMQQSQITFKSSEPQGVFNFQIKHRYLYDDNKVVVHKHMEKAYGVWSGYLILKNGTRFEFGKAFGLVEICKSRF